MSRPGFLRLAACAWPLAMASCAHSPLPDRSPPGIAGQEGYVEAQAAGDRPARETGGTWWTSFQDPELSSLIQVALRGNPDLEVLVSRVEQADALVRQAGGRLIPQLNAGGEIDARRVSSLSGSTSQGWKEDHELGGFMRWELDVWGRLRDLRASRKGEAQAARFDWLAGRLLLSASVAEIYFSLVETRQQLALAHQQLASNQTLLELTRLRFGQGQSSVVDVLQQQEQLAGTEARMPGIQAEERALQYSLDVLLGRVPQAQTLRAAGELHDLPPPPVGGIPTDLLRNRPDLVAALNRVEAIDHSVAAAVASRLPTLELNASLLAGGPPGIQSLTESLSAALLGPVVDGEIRRAEVDRQRARLREALSAYASDYLNAVREVETAAVQERRRREGLERLEWQLEVARSLLRETRNRYSQGLTDYLPVVNALATTQNLERQVLVRKRELLLLRVALHRALGGPMPSPGSDPAPSQPKDS